MEENVTSEAPDVNKSIPAWLKSTAKFIGDYGGPVPVMEVLDRVAQETNDKYEVRAIRRLLRRYFKEIRWDHIDDPTCEWDDSYLGSETPPTAMPIAEMFTAWGKSSDQEREGLKQEFEVQLASSKLSKSDVQLARVIGIDSSEPDWNFVDIQRCEELNLIRRASEMAPIWWCIDAAVTIKGAQRESAKLRIDSLDPSDRSIEAISSVERWLGREDRSAIPEMLRGLKTLIKAAPDTSLISLACRYSSALCSENDADHLIAALVGLITAADIQTIASVFEENIETDNLRELLIALARMKRPFKDRRAVILATATSSRAGALLDPAVFANLALSEIGDLISSAQFVDVANEGLQDHLYRPVKSAISVKFGDNLAAVANFPGLESLVPIDVLERQIQNDEPSARVARLAANELIKKAVSDERARGRIQIDGLTEQLSVAKQDIADQQASREENARTAAAMEERLRQATNQTVHSTDLEIAQARMDVVTAMIDQAIKLGDLASTMDTNGPLASLCFAIERDLQKFGVEKVGNRNEVTEFDPSLHEHLDVPEGTLVNIVRPAYRRSVDATVIRLGLVAAGPPP